MLIFLFGKQVEHALIRISRVDRDQNKAIYSISNFGLIS